MKRILIVEDDSDMQEIYRSMFSKEDEYSIDIMEDAQAALKKLKQDKYDMAILDIIMEPMSGDSFFVHARNEIAIKNIPILVVSVLKKDTLNFLSTLGNFHYIQKPITKQDLLGKIRKILI